MHSCGRLASSGSWLKEPSTNAVSELGGKCHIAEMRTLLLDAVERTVHQVMERERVARGGLGVLERLEIQRLTLQRGGRLWHGLQAQLEPRRAGMAGVQAAPMRTIMRQGRLYLSLHVHSSPFGR